MARSSLRRRLTVVLFAGVFGIFGSLDAGAFAADRGSDQSQSQDTAKPCKKKKPKKCKKRGGRGGGGVPGPVIGY